MRQVILPQDVVVGDIKVDEHGKLPRPELANQREDQNNGKGPVGEADGTGDEAFGADPAFSYEEDVSASDVEPEDESLGFEYEGEVKPGPHQGRFWDEIVRERGQIVQQGCKRSRLHRNAACTGSYRRLLFTHPKEC